MQKCKCCGDKTTSPASPANGRGYNILGGETRKWAVGNGLPLCEFCVPVKGGKKFGGPDWVKNKCGDGRLGFTIRRRGQTDVRIAEGLDGQLLKSKTTLVRTKSARARASRRPRRIDGSRCGLMSSVAIYLAFRDPIVVAKLEKESAKAKRARNRNNAARRGRRRTVRASA